MFRRLLILAFTLSVFSNSLSAAAMIDDDECGACCRTAGSERRMTMSMDCCYSECGGPSDSQRPAPKDMLAIERWSKTAALVAVNPVTLRDTHSSTVLPTAARTVVSSTHLYLRIGTLLI